jgi:ribosome-associated toxin RatA of RatAB toxin-antitoxin module
VHTGNSILIRAPRERIFEIVSDLSRWTEHLPHYRYVKRLGKDGEREIVAMSARRGIIPVSWVSTYHADRETLEMHFEHIRKWTKGMVVVWKLNGTRDGTRVDLVHDLRFRFRPLAWFAEPVIASFVSAIAVKTLETFKEIIEREGVR